MRCRSAPDSASDCECDDEICDVYAQHQNALQLVELLEDERGHDGDRCFQRADGHVEIDCLGERAGRDGERAAGNERTQRQNDGDVDDVRAQNVADRHGRLLFDDSGDGGDKLGQRCADGDHRDGDHALRHADHLGQLRAVIHQKVRADDQARRAQDEQNDVPDNGLFALVDLDRLRLGRSRFHPGAAHVFKDEQCEQNQHQYALEHAQLPVDAQYPQQHAACHHQKPLGRELRALNDGGQEDDRQRHDKARVRRDRADGVADGHFGAAFGRGHGGDDDLGHGGGDGDDGRADDELRDAGGGGHPAGGIDEPVAAFDNQYQTEQKQNDGEKQFHTNFLAFRVKWDKKRDLLHVHAKSLVPAVQAHDHRPGRAMLTMRK